MTATLEATSDPIHLWANSSGSAVTTRCGLVLELPPLASLNDINVTTYPGNATCSPCRHPSNYH